MSRTHILQPSPPRQASGLRRWREGKVRPIPGSSPHDRPVSRGISSSLKESLRRSLPRHRIPHQSRIILGAQYAFSKAWRNLSGPMGFNFKSQVKTKSWVGTRPPPAGRPRAQAKERAGRNTLFLIVRRMSSGRLFLDRVGRHQSPSPLRRQGHHSTRVQRVGNHPTASRGLSGCLTLGVHRSSSVGTEVGALVDKTSETMAAV